MIQLVGLSRRTGIPCKALLDFDALDKVNSLLNEVKIGAISAKDRDQACNSARKYGYFLWTVDLETMIQATPSAKTHLKASSNILTAKRKKKDLHKRWKEISAASIELAIIELIIHKNPEFMHFIDYLNDTSICK